ncbi:hypothetical protein [Pontibacter rugosus]|uniref:Uncharacterized protein n=1 Tax=Pontibacter rugosus TaxID=1745966 RepID=A0ABW3SJA3_9BACT
MNTMSEFAIVVTLDQSNTKLYKQKAETAEQALELQLEEFRSSFPRSEGSFSLEVGELESTVFPYHGKKEGSKHGLLFGTLWISKPNKFVNFERAEGSYSDWAKKVIAQ